LTVATESLPATARGYSYAEVEKILASGSPDGRLTRNDLPTPALIVDLGAFERNVRKMADYVKGKGYGLRPHAKTHKCPEIARAQVAAGALGVGAAKLSEAEVLAAHGLRGLLVTTAVIGRHKIERAVALAAAAPDTMFVVDDENNAQDLSDAAQAAKLTLNVALDLYVGRRTGIATGAPAVALAEKVLRLPGLNFVGLQAYAGFASHTVTWAERRDASREAMSGAVETRRLLEKKGIAVGFLAGGSTGTYNIDTDIPGITEMQAGSYVFMDVDYGRIGGQDGGEKYSDFENALFVITTVVSHPEPKKAVVDAGLKAFSTDRGIIPEALGVAGLVYGFAGDEHGRLDLVNASRDVKLGERLEFVIPHCDPTVNLYDRLYAVRGDKVEKVWKIAGRGMTA
jgi:3-hydroxy-D-aspartate aldolase